MPTFHIRRNTLPADETTPVRVYRQLRAFFSPAVLLESNNFEQARDTHSVIGIDPLIELRVQDGELTRTQFYDATERVTRLMRSEVMAAFEREVARVDYEGDPGEIDGFFGFTSFDAYRFVEPKLEGAGAHLQTPDLHYLLFRFLLTFDHFHERLDVIEFVPPDGESLLPRLLPLLRTPLTEPDAFAPLGPETSDLTDEAYEELVARGKAHCDRGDTFQIVLSRGYTQRFRGDDFNVYRELRRLNPSPYCFYFDFGPYRMFGASPEALLTVGDDRAEMRPIAGTYGVTGDRAADDAAAARLLADPKENAEHRMLVDLARNDLSRSCYPVRVDQLREVERYSHLMHIVSRVSGRIEADVSAYGIYAQCFPAGTLSGAPKFKAVELIYRYEVKPRGAYGGGLGYVSPLGGFDHCILIRSAVVVGDVLSYRAGAGVVSASDEVKEREEVTHKTNALREAIRLAGEEVSSGVQSAEVQRANTRVHDERR